MRCTKLILTSVLALSDSGVGFDSIAISWNEAREAEIYCNTNSRITIGIPAQSEEESRCNGKSDWDWDLDSPE